MDSFKISTGKIGVPIERDGEDVGVFYFNPSDIASARKILDLKKDFEVKEKEFKKESKNADTEEKQVALLEEIVNYFRDKIDEVYGQGTSNLLFGEARVLDMFSGFFDGINHYYMKASQERMAKARSNIRKSGK